MGIVVVGQKLLELWRSKNWNMWFSAVFRGLSRRNFGGQGKTDPPMTQSGPPAFIWYRFHGCGLHSLGVYKRTKSKKERDGQTDGRTGRTDRQVQNYIPTWSDVKIDKLVFKGCQVIDISSAWYDNLKCCRTIARYTVRVHVIDFVWRALPLWAKICNCLGTHSHGLTIKPISSWHPCTMIVLSAHSTTIGTSRTELPPL